MTSTRLLLAASLGLALAACSGQQQAEGTAVEPAAGEMPQAGDTGAVTGSPAPDALDADTAGATTGDAGAMGDTMTDPTAPTPVDPMQDPTLQTDPALQETTPPATDPATTPPPGQ